ncbi:MAG: glycosyltransferase family 4 protein [Chloroflexi bacterium]|nr:glycosyltransferase family 4 protein [Chloroflexota bacterium]
MKAMKYKVTIYCPDQHFIYNIQTLDNQGAGGGVTARIRVAHALAAQGHAVTIINNCPSNQTIDGVRYVHCEQTGRIETDIFIASTSGGGLDMSELRKIEIHARLQILMVHGVGEPLGIDLRRFDHIYALSNFVRDKIVNKWGIDAHNLFTSHHGVQEDHYHLSGNKVSKRDPFGIVYTGHPSKGLDAALQILQLLGKSEPRFSLHVYGGYRLWGEKEKQIEDVPGLTYHGLIGQRELAQEIQQYAYALNLQNIEEGFGLALIEAMRAGCVVIASPVGAYPEIIHHGYNGLFIDGDSFDERTHLEVSRIILGLMRHPGYQNFISRNASTSPLHWSTVAETWTEHWDWALDGSQSLTEKLGLRICPACGANWLPLADGLHCMGCGRYQKSLSP